VRQPELAAARDRGELDDHPALVIGLAGDSPGELQPARAVNDEIAAHVIDVLTLAAHEERERSADARIGLDSQDPLVAQRLAEHPAADQYGVEPRVERDLRRRGELLRNRHEEL
jgi:hypothetical protein